MSDTENITDKILEQMYEEAEPGLDFMDLRDNPSEYPDDWYDQHHLDNERQQEIIEEHCSQHDLTQRERSSVEITCILNYGPRGFEEVE